jgi:hypothetical protein
MSRILLALALLFSAGAAAAAEKSWFETMVKGLRTKVQKKLQSRDRVSAVAAVRGAKQGGDPFALYWKGGVSEAAQKKLDADKEKLAAAVQLVVDGDETGGRAALDLFLKESPDSFYAEDAKEALGKLGAAADNAGGGQGEKKAE